MLHQKRSALKLASAIAEINIYKKQTRKSKMHQYQSERLKRIKNNKRQELIANTIIGLIFLATYLITIEHMVSLALD